MSVRAVNERVVELNDELPLDEGLLIREGQRSLRFEELVTR
jgi:hypothetical protein